MDDKTFSNLSFDQMLNMTDAELASARGYANSVKNYNATKNLDTAISAAALISSGGYGVVTKLLGSVVSAEMRTKIVHDSLQLAWDVFDSVIQGSSREVDLSDERADTVIRDLLH